MCSTVVCLMLLSVLIAILSLAVDGGNTSSVSNKIPPNRDGNSVVVTNVVQDSNCNEAIKSLEATMEKKFEQLMAAINRTSSHGNSAGDVFSVLFFYFCFCSFKHHFNVFCCISSCVGQSFASCRDIYVNHKWVISLTIIRLMVDKEEVKDFFCHIRSVLFKAKLATISFEKHSYYWVNTIVNTTSGSLFGIFEVKRNHLIVVS